MEKTKISWTNSVVLIGTPILAIYFAIQLIVARDFGFSDLAIFLGFYGIIGFSITAGYHRYYSHRTFQCNKFVQLIFLVFGAAALQNSVIAWAGDHRRHHQFEDQEEDPYAVRKGFWWAHWLWIFFEPLETPSTKNIPDLTKDKLVMWQQKYYIPLAVFSGFILPMLVGACFGRAWQGLIWGGLFRLVILHHLTFLINSAAHWFGKQTFSQKHTARDNWFLAIVTFGEGYHNFHHTFPNDYRNGYRWYHWDPTKWIIRGLSRIKFVWSLRKTSEETISSRTLKPAGEESFPPLPAPKTV